MPRELTSSVASTLVKPLVYRIHPQTVYTPWPDLNDPDRFHGVAAGEFAIAFAARRAHRRTLAICHQRPSRIAVTGAGGLLGSELCRHLGAAALPLDVDDLDLTQASSVRGKLSELAPDLIINTAAYTRVDQAESEAEPCWAVNRDAVRQLAETAAHLNCRLVQISTDYVFSGQPDARPPSPWKENDSPAPTSVYAASKLAGEQAAAAIDNHLIVRTCGLYGSPGPRSGSNFVTTILRLAEQRDVISVVDDQICSPTSVRQLVPALLFLATSAWTGTFHVVNRGEISWCQFARRIVALADRPSRVVAISTDQFGAAAKRPAYSVLDTTKYQATGGPPMSTIEDALSEFMRSHG